MVLCGCKALVTSVCSANGMPVESHKAIDGTAIAMNMADGIPTVRNTCDWLLVSRRCVWFSIHAKQYQLLR